MYFLPKRKTFPIRRPIRGMIGRFCLARSRSCFALSSSCATGLPPTRRPPSYHQSLSSFSFFLIAAFNLINDYGHKSFKSDGVSSLKAMRNHEMEPGSSSRAPMGYEETNSWSTTPNRRNLVHHGQVFPYFLFDVVYDSYFCNKCVGFL
jgi:hypothetical protein